MPPSPNYGHSERNKYRAVFYYLLTKHFGDALGGRQVAATRSD